MTPYKYNSVHWAFADDEREPAQEHYLLFSPFLMLLLFLVFLNLPFVGKRQICSMHFYSTLSYFWLKLILFP